jgi:serine protease
VPIPDLSTVESPIRLPAPQPNRRQRRRHRPDLHRQPLLRTGQRHLEAPRPGRRRRRHQPHRRLEDQPVPA